MSFEISTSSNHDEVPDLCENLHRVLQEYLRSGKSDQSPAQSPDVLIIAWSGIWIVW